jgi:hypothetical protein
VPPFNDLHFNLAQKVTYYLYLHISDLPLLVVHMFGLITLQ